MHLFGGYRDKASLKVYPALAIVTGLMVFAAAPSQAQVIAPNLSAPPCVGRGCLTVQRGATVPHKTHAPAQQCPQGTVFVSRTGTCKVYKAD
jgi:hypothetical protein